MQAELIADSNNGVTLLESKALRSAHLGDADAATARARIEATPDYTSYHLLIALERSQPAVYRRIAPEIRASVLCGALAHVRYYNDWGYLDPSQSHDGAAATALLDTGKAALPSLARLLDDHTPAPLFGSEEATMSSLYHYRRADFAARYVALLLGEPARFEREPAQRDVEIAALKGRLAKALGAPHP